MKLISSIKVISQRLAGLFLAEIKDIRNFPNAKKLIKYAGTDPVVKQSGKYKLRMSISKQGIELSQKYSLPDGSRCGEMELLL